MISMRRPVLGLDVGSAETRAVIADMQLADDGSETVQILGVGVAQSEGLSGPTVTNLEAATKSMRAAIRQAELMADREVEDAYIGVSGAHVDISRSTGVVAIDGVEVVAADLARVEAVGRAIPIQPDTELIHALCQEYVVDGRRGIRDPVGMTATRLESEVCIVTARSDACRVLRSAVDRAGYRPAEVVLDSLASALAVLTEQEREAGAALIEIGAASTDLVVFDAGKIRHLRSVPWGSNSITRDIARGLGVPEEEALRLKEEYGAALKRSVDPHDKLEVSGPTVRAGRRVGRELLAHIIEQRLDEILGIIYDDLEDLNLRDNLGAGVVLTGGGASLPATVELARAVFNLPVRLGEPGVRLGGLVDAVRRPKYAAGVGLALYGSMRGRRTRLGGFGRVAGRLGDWLRDFF